MPDKIIQISLQVVISMHFQVVLSIYFQAVFSSSKNVTTGSSHASKMYFQVYVLTRSYTFNGNEVEARHKKGVEKVITYYLLPCTVCLKATHLVYNLRKVLLCLIIFCVISFMYGYQFQFILARLAVTSKEAWFKSKRYVSLVLCVGLLGFVSYTVLCMTLCWPDATLCILHL